VRKLTTLHFCYQRVCILIKIINNLNLIFHQIVIKLFVLKDNYGHMCRLVSELRSTVDKVAEGGGGAAVQRHKEKGKLLARERVDLLLDPGSPFLELSQLAAHDLYPGENVPAAGIITGVGRVHGTECVVVANDATVKV